MFHENPNAIYLQYKDSRAFASLVTAMQISIDATAGWAGR